MPCLVVINTSGDIGFVLKDPAGKVKVKHCIEYKLRFLCALIFKIDIPYCYIHV